MPTLLRLRSEEPKRLPGTTPITLVMKLEIEAKSNDLASKSLALPTDGYLEHPLSLVLERPKVRKAPQWRTSQSQRARPSKNLVLRTRRYPMVPPPSVGPQGPASLQVHPGTPFVIAWRRK